MKSGEVVPFVKATACGNDFLIVEEVNPSADLPGLSRRMCDRHNGVGADGVEWLFPDATADIHARLINADGSEAEISGNGTRCVAAYLYLQKVKGKIVVRTGAGLKTCSLISHDKNRYEFEVAMGKPQVGEETSIPLEKGEMKGREVSMGNPHFVSIVKSFPEDWQKTAAQMQRNSRFRHGINIEMVVLKDQSNISARFFERGVGETQSSGTGSCAAAVAAIAGKQVQSPVKVHAPGGTQTVRWAEEIFLTGPASILFCGEFFI